MLTGRNHGNLTEQISLLSVSDPSQYAPLDGLKHRIIDGYEKQMLFKEMLMDNIEEEYENS